MLKSRKPHPDVPAHGEDLDTIDRKVVDLLSENDIQVHEFHVDDRDDGAPFEMWTLVVERVAVPKEN